MIKDFLMVILGAMVLIGAIKLAQWFSRALDLPAWLSIAMVLIIIWTIYLIS